MSDGGGCDAGVGIRMGGRGLVFCTLQLKQEADAKKKKLAQDAKDRVAADKRAKLEVTK